MLKPTQTDLTGEIHHYDHASMLGSGVGSRDTVTLTVSWGSSVTRSPVAAGGRSTSPDECEDRAV